MCARDVLSPICGTFNEGVDLGIADGWMECECCGSTVRMLAEDNSCRAVGCQWQIVQKLPYRKK